jgi:invasion protein IalB
MHLSKPLGLLVALAVLGLASGPGGVPARAQEAPAEEAPKPEPTPRPKPKKPAPKEAAPAAAPAAPAAAATAPAAIWPAGASAVSETYADWTTNCARAEARTACVVSQAQGNARTGRREFAFELKAPVDGRADGVILMPHGFAIEPGVTFKLDEATLGKGAPYMTCSGEGCLVPVSFPTLATDTMMTAKTLTILAMKPDAKEPTVITVPLGGFASAFARAIALGQ